MNPRDIVVLARQISREAEALDRLLSQEDSQKISNGVLVPSQESVLWNHPIAGSPVEQGQSRILGLIQQLNRSLRGPQDYLHEFVASNWDKGALYCLLEHHVLDQIPIGGTATLHELAEKTDMPAEKLLPLLRLAACEQVVEEPATETFSHGLISQELVQDAGLRAFIAFQLYETRVASAHLSDSLRRRPNPFWTGQSAFKYAWGQSMYDWHQSHPEKGARFGAAMKSVAASLDPGNQLLLGWCSAYAPGADASQPVIITEITHTFGPSLQYLTDKVPSSSFEHVRIPDNPSQFAIEQCGSSSPHIYIVKSVLWNLADDDCVLILKRLAHVLEQDPRSLILVNDLMSPAPGTFEPHVDKAYRRRDVTVMTMHNAQLRTEEGWLRIFQQANPNFSVQGSVGYSNHSCRGQWELRQAPSHGRLNGSNGHGHDSIAST